MIRVLLFALALLVASSASAGSWVDCGDSAATSRASLRPGNQPSNTICFEWTATGDGTLIDTSSCTLDIGPLVPSMTDTLTGATAYVYRCGHGTPGSAPTARYCQAMDVDTDNDGLPNHAPMDGVTTGLKGQQWQTATLLYVSPQAATSGKTARLMITCH